MTKILLAPSFGNSKSKKRYRATIEGWVRFEDDALRRLLTDGELSDLRERHPAGIARFWGARSAHNKMMAKLVPGDVVLFTGDNKVKAAAEVGVRFHNKRFGDKLWRYSEDEDSFVHVYSVVNLRPIERPKADLLSLPGFSMSDPLAGQRYVHSDRVREVLGTFGIVPRLAETLLEEMVERRLRSSRITAVERAHSEQVTRTTVAGTTVTERVEIALQCLYEEFRPQATVRSFRTESNRRADLYVEEGDEVEVVEAKSLAVHGKVREAVAQLLDYASASPKPVTRLTGLFPDEPDAEGLAFLHRLGIDCVFLSSDETFTRRPAPDSRREYMLPIWHGV